MTLPASVIVPALNNCLGDASYVSSAEDEFELVNSFEPVPTLGRAFRLNY